MNLVGGKVGLLVSDLSEIPSLLEPAYKYFRRVFKA